MYMYIYNCLVCSAIWIQFDQTASKIFHSWVFWAFTCKLTFCKHGWSDIYTRLWSYKRLFQHRSEVEICFCFKICTLIVTTTSVMNVVFSNVAIICIWAAWWHTSVEIQSHPHALSDLLVLHQKKKKKIPKWFDLF